MTPNTAWLIESRDPATHRTHDYVRGIEAATPRILFTKDAAEAAQFATKEAAQDLLDAVRVLDPSGAFAVEEHAFNCDIAGEDLLEIPRFLRKNDD
jgi:hypothetical protein